MDSIKKIVYLKKEVPCDMLAHIRDKIERIYIQRIVEKYRLTSYCQHKCRMVYSD